MQPLPAYPSWPKINTGCIERFNADTANVDNYGNKFNEQFIADTANVENDRNKFKDSSFYLRHKTLPGAQEQTTNTRISNRVEDIRVDACFLMVSPAARSDVTFGVGEAECRGTSRSCEESLDYVKPSDGNVVPHPTTLAGSVGETERDTRLEPDFGGFECQHPPGHCNKTGDTSSSTNSYARHKEKASASAATSLVPVRHIVPAIDATQRCSITSELPGGSTSFPNWSSSVRSAQDSDYEHIHDQPNVGNCFSQRQVCPSYRPLHITLTDAVNCSFNHSQLANDGNVGICLHELLYDFGPSRRGPLDVIDRKTPENSDAGTELELGLASGTSRRTDNAGHASFRERLYSASLATSFQRNAPHLSWSRSFQLARGRSNEPDDQGKPRSHGSVSRFFGLALRGCRPQKDKKPLTLDEYATPLHVKDVPLINWQRAEATITDESRLAWNTALAMITNIEFLQLHTPSPNLETAPEADITTFDRDLLLQQHYIQPYDPRSIMGVTRVFTVMEKDDTRRRLIVVPDELNEVIDLRFKHCNIRLPSVEEIGGDVLFAFAITGDVNAYYSSFELPQNTRQYFAFHFQGEWFVPTRIPTGYKPCPMLAQALIQSLIKSTLGPQEGGNRNVQGRGYIDNVRFAGDDEKVLNECMKRFVLATQHVGMRFEITSATSDRTYDFLGVHCDHQLQTTSTAFKTIKKLLVLRVRQTLKVRDLLHMLGLLVWSARCANIPLEPFYPVIKFFRRRVAVVSDLDQNIEIWASVLPLLNHWISLAVNNEPRKITTGSTLQITIFSDACPSGWGTMIFFRQEVTVAFGPWETILPLGLPIAQYEAKATCLGVSQLSVMTNPVTLNLIVDNTSWVGTVHKMFPRNYWLNHQKQELKTLLRERRIDNWDIYWISTTNNLADVFSRIKTKDAYRLTLQVPATLAYEHWRTIVEDIRKKCCCDLDSD